LRDNIEATVTLEGIDEKMEIRLIKFFNKELRKTSKSGGRSKQVNLNALDDTI